MDPFSIFGLAGSVVSVLDVLTRSLTSLGRLASRYNNALPTVQIMISQLSTLRLALSQLLEWIRLGPTGVEGNTDLLSNLHTSVSGCELLINLLDADLQGFQVNGNRPGKRTQFAFLETCFQERQTHLSHHVVFLSFLLQAINW